MIITTTAPQFTEAQVRSMRDKVFEQPTTDNNWEACKDKWMAPGAIEFLLAECEKIDARARAEAPAAKKGARQ